MTAERHESPYVPDAPLYDDGHPLSIAFRTRADYEAWLSRHPEQRPFQNAAPLDDARRRYEEWRAAGSAGLPPEWTRARDFFRDRFGLDV